MEGALSTAVENKLPIIELLKRLSNPANNSQERVLAEQFRVMFVEDLWRFCKKACEYQFAKRPDRKQIAEDVFSDAFITVFGGLKNFKFPKNANESDVQKIIRTWLAKIANNRIQQQRGIIKKEKENIDGYKAFLKLGLDKGSSGTRIVSKSYDHQKIITTWNNLCELSKDIILTCCEYDCFPRYDHATRQYIKNKKHLPKDVKQHLLDKHGTSDANFRKVKERAFADIFGCATNPELTKN